CSNQTRAEQQEFLRMHLYYSSVRPESLRSALRNKPDDSADALLNVGTVIFGHQRVFQHISPEFRPIREDEIEREVATYETYAKSFSREEALKRPITYAIIPVE